MLEQWETAVKFYTQAVKIPITEAEIRQRASMYQAVMSMGKHSAHFTVNLREEMAECLLKLGNNDEAQKWMEEAAAIRKENGLALNAFLAGRVQRASGQRVIEEHIQAEELVSKNDPAYWRQRARYYQGRNEPNQQGEALLKGLALTVPQPRPEHLGKGHQDLRSGLLGDYVHFLQKQNRDSEAVTLLRKEIREAPAGTESSERAACLLAFEFPKYVRADDSVLWNWLASRPVWEHTEERLLWRMFCTGEGGMLGGVPCPAQDLDKHFSHAETLTSGKDPTRAATLGWIMNRIGFAQRSIPLLKYAVEKTDKKELKERVQFTLFESYLDTNDWENAEEMLSFACSRLTAKEIPSWYSKVAVIAAKSWNKADAMRIWKRMANFSPYYMGGLETLAENGLKTDLTEFYNKMHEELPSSGIPLKALSVLKG